MVKQGDKVLIDGKEAVVETSWGQGAHRAFKLSDGRVVLDLDKLVASGKASVVKEQPKVVEKSTRKWDWLPNDGKHDLEE